MSTGPEPKRNIEAGNEVVCLPSCKVGTNKTERTRRQSTPLLVFKPVKNKIKLEKRKKSMSFLA